MELHNLCSTTTIRLNKKSWKFSVSTPRRHIGEAGVYLHSLDGGEWRTSRTGRFTLVRTRYPLNISWVGPRAGMDVLRRKIPLPLQGFEPPISQVIAYSQQSLRCTGSLYYLRVMKLKDAVKSGAGRNNTHERSER